MELKRFFGIKSGNCVYLEGDEFLHCTRVTRHKVGYSLIVCTGDGYDYHAVITEIGQDRLCAEITAAEQNSSEPRGRIILCQAVCKELDFIMQKAVELGVTEFVPYISERVNAKPIPTARAEKIVLEAAKQCGRASLPLVSQTLNFGDAILKFADVENKVFCYEAQRENTVVGAISKLKNDVVIFIGSEGGFTANEVALATENGYAVCTLGKRILRAETAAITALTLALSGLGEL